MILSKNEIERILNKDTLNFKEMKEITKYAIDEEMKKDNLNTPFNLLSFGEYYKSDVFKKRIKLQKTNNKFDVLITPLNCKGFRFDSELFVFSYHHSRIFYLNKNEQLVDLLRTAFHEYSHYRQSKKHTEYSLYDNFCHMIEDFIHINSISWYNKHWEIFVKEKLADLDGLMRIKEFLKQYPKYYNKSIKNIDKYIELYEFYLGVYSFNFIFKKFHKIVLTGNFEFEDIANLFYKTNSNEFKTVSEITEIHHPSILSEILTTDPFINQLDFSSLNFSELYIMREAVYKKLKEEKEKNLYIKNFFNKNNSFFLKINLVLGLKQILLENPHRIRFLEDNLIKIDELIKNINIKHTK